MVNSFRDGLCRCGRLCDSVSSPNGWLSCVLSEILSTYPTFPTRRSRDLIGNDAQRRRAGRTGGGWQIEPVLACDYVGRCECGQVNRWCQISWSWGEEEGNVNLTLVLPPARGNQSVITEALTSCFYFPCKQKKYSAQSVPFTYSWFLLVIERGTLEMVAQVCWCTPKGQFDEWNDNHYVQRSAVASVWPTFSFVSPQKFPSWWMYSHFLLLLPTGVLESPLLLFLLLLFL